MRCVVDCFDVRGILVVAWHTSDCRRIAWEFPSIWVCPCVYHFAFVPLIDMCLIVDKVRTESRNSPQIIWYRSRIAGHARVTIYAHAYLFYVYSTFNSTFLVVLTCHVLCMFHNLDNEKIFNMPPPTISSSYTHSKESQYKICCYVSLVSETTST